MYRISMMIKYTINYFGQLYIWANFYDKRDIKNVNKNVET